MESQLNRLAAPDFELPSAADHLTGRVVSLPAGQVPVVYWPDGRFCLYVNLFLLQLWERRVSHRTRGGTLGTYAGVLSHLIRFAFRRGRDFHLLSDADFHAFVTELVDGRREQSGVKRREINTVLAIARISLDFLSWVGEFRCDGTLVGRYGQIRAERRESSWRGQRRGNEGKRSYYWHHAALPLPEAKHRRTPIPSRAIAALRKASATVSRSIHQKVRRLAMLTVLEVTGGRREEVVNLTVSDVMAVADGSRSDLRLITVKKRGGKTSERFIPVSRSDIKFLADFIRVNRKAVVAKTLGKAKDHGFVFVNIITGQRLATNTITQEVSILANAAGLSAVTCPHMFRHRFITKIFVQLIEQHNLDNRDELRMLLLSGKDLKQKLLQWTGHSNTSSLDYYIDLAFEEISGIKASIDNVLNRREVEGVQGTLRDMANAAENGDLIVSATDLRALASALDGRHPKKPDR